MPVPKHLAAGKRFGARYGRRVKDAFIKVENEQRARHKCPYCGKIAAKFQAIGIWKCLKCGSKFTGKAYSPTLKVITKIEKAVAEDRAAAKAE